MVQNSLQYYVSALMESIGDASVSTAFAGQNSTDNNSTLVDGVANYDECARNDSGGGGIFSRIGNAISNFVGSAACEISSTVSDVVQEVDAARGYLDNSAEESPGQINATFTNVDVRHPVGVVFLLVTAVHGLASLKADCCPASPDPALPRPVSQTYICIVVLLLS